MSGDTKYIFRFQSLVYYSSYKTKIHFLLPWVLKTLFSVNEILFYKNIVEFWKNNCHNFLLWADEAMCRSLCCAVLCCAGWAIDCVVSGQNLWSAFPEADLAYRKYRQLSGMAKEEFYSKFFLINLSIQFILIKLFNQHLRCNWFVMQS